MISLEQIQAVVNQIAEKFHPDRIILFGSYAYGKATEDSDVDLLVIMPIDGSAVDQICRIRRFIQKSFPLDLLVKTPEEIEWRYEGYDPLVRHALDQGRTLYG